MDRRFWIASLAVFAILFATMYVVNGILLVGQWLVSAPNLLRYWDVDPNGGLSELNLYHFMVIPFVLWAVTMVWLYKRGVGNRPWAGQGALFGLVMALATVVPFRLFNYASMGFSDGGRIVPSPVLLEEMASWTLALVVAGVVVAWFYRSEAAAVVARR